MTELAGLTSAGPEPCARCGADADFDIASLWLCLNCYHVAGSTCAGIGPSPWSTPRASAEATDQVC